MVLGVGVPVCTRSTDIAAGADEPPRLGSIAGYNIRILLFPCRGYGWSTLTPPPADLKRLSPLPRRITPSNTTGGLDRSHLGTTRANDGFFPGPFCGSVPLALPPSVQVDRGTATASFQEGWDNTWDWSPPCKRSPRSRVEGYGQPLPISYRGKTIYHTAAKGWNQFPQAPTCSNSAGCAPDYFYCHCSPRFLPRLRRLI
jgi:hypothetical protein